MTENSDGQKTIQDLQSVSLHLEKSVKDDGQQSSLQSGSYDTVASDFAEEYRTKSARDHPAVKSTSVEYPKSTADYTLSTHPESQMKQDAVESDNILRDSFEENHGSPSRLSHGSMNSAPISMANKFLPGQSTQTAGPTPTLNQLLQASTPVHRFHSAYSSAAADTFQQWPVQRSPVQPVFPQSSQKLTVQGSPRSYQGSGTCTSSNAAAFQSYNPRFSSPARSHSPYNNHHHNHLHQAAPYATNSNHSSSYYPEARTWNHPGSANASMPSPTSQFNQSSPSTQRAMSQSPAPPSSASPQPSGAIVSQELSGQNSNDSSSGLMNPATPSSQGLRPTPSPTGSTGSRSLSPAVGQLSSQIPPRPPSSQSDGGPSGRMCLSPLAAQAQTEDLNPTSKIRKESGGYQSNSSITQAIPGTPNLSNMGLIQEDYGDMNSAGWSRTSTSPVYSNHVPQDLYRSKKSDHLSKLYEMDDAVERRSWLDKLVNFMEDRRTPITSCPTISKNPLDLFRLYLCVKERGGFMEVCKVTKNKTWKDIAGLLGIGASSSAAYTLRKHYTKHLLAFECHFDRGGIDPQPIINQIEASSKKKIPKGATSVPSPGSSNSQDSFSASNTNNLPVESYANYSSQYQGSSSSSPSMDYGTNSSRSQNQNNTPHQTSQHGNYQNPNPFHGYPQEQNIRAYGSVGSQQNDFNQTYVSRSLYSSYASEAERNFPGDTGNSTSDAYKMYTVNQQQSSYPAGSLSASRQSFSLSAQSLPTNLQQASQTAQQVSQQTQGQANSAYAPSLDYFTQDQTSYAISIGNQSYPSSGNCGKSMPPPSAGSQQPRRHPDFVKEQSSTAFHSARPSFAGWPSGSNQYGATPVKMQFPNQHPQTTSSHQLPHTFQTSAPNASSPPSNTANQLWTSQQSNRTSSSNINTLIHTPPWDHRQNQSSSLYTPSTTHQGQLGVSSIVGNQPAPKRELTFPADSVEAVTPVPLKRRRLTRTNIAPIEAWRIMMSLRSGLLAESCWALDVLNILLFDDLSVHYFGLSHLPGLLDTLLEHFTRSLSDMLDFTLNDSVRCTSQMGWMDSRVDLGAVTEPIDPGDHITLLSSPNFTLTSRRGKPVRLPTRDEDLFVLDHQRSWDSKTDEIEIESWQVGRNTIEYIVTYLESEIGINSRPRVQVRSECSAPQMISGTSALIDESSENGSLDVDILGTSQSQNEKNSDMDRRSSHERKRKNRSMNDVLSKIERPPVEMDDLSREISEKKSDNLKNLNKKGDTHTFSRTPEIVTPQGHSLSNEERSQSENSDRDYSLHKVTDQESGRENDKSLTSGPSLHEPCSMNIILSSGDGITLKLKIRDPAGTLTRRRMSDHENESYSKDDASLYLVTETQDSIAKRCVCLSTILRNLTFIPGNEAEFARNVSFLGLTGKLLLLHHEHPARAQKTRNYDREEDADSSDSCSSLQSETEWWWDFLHHVRENVLVISANIAGYIDLSLYSEEISRPILDGLLHWAVCPAAHGQDPFPTVSLNSALSPQRLALEALCKLCVTENNVDLVIATPPYCRLQKLCSVLARLLCRSEEQVLREFGINLLYFLSAADSGIARTIALQTSCIALLIIFIEQAENSALTIANQHGIAALRDNPDSMGTSLDMLRRAAGTLLNLARHPNNRTLLLQYEARILALVMSQILDQQVAAVLAKVLFKCSRVTA